MASISFEPIEKSFGHLDAHGGEIAYEEKVQSPEEKALAEAKAKFADMDDDGNGTLEGEEISRLADWMWTAFHPNGKPVPAAQRAKMEARLMKSVSDTSGGISFEHFAEWFGGISKGVHRMEMKAAHKKFKEMDDDNSGFLDHDEIRHMAEWMAASVNPGGKPMSDKAKEKMTAKLIQRVTDDPAGKISFDQFEHWYTKTAASMNALAVKRYQKTHEPEKVEAVKEGKTEYGVRNNDSITTDMHNMFTTDKDLAEEKALKEAKRKFKEMDKDGNGTLEGAEITRLAEWILTSFHPNGRPVPAAQRERRIISLNKHIGHQAAGGFTFEHFAEWFAGISKGIHKVEMRAAHKKFKEMDDDNSGYLDHDEIRHMAEWISTCLHPGGKPMTDKAKEEMTAKLIKRVTEDPAGKISFDQFEHWYTRTARQMNSFAIRQYEKTHKSEK